MAARKRWSVTISPTTQTTQFTSMTRAYERVNALMTMRREGMTRINQIIVRESDAGTTDWHIVEVFRWNGQAWTP